MAAQLGSDRIRQVDLHVIPDFRVVKHPEFSQFSGDWWKIETYFDEHDRERFFPHNQHVTLDRGPDKFIRLVQIVEIKDLQGIFGSFEHSPSSTEQCNELVWIKLVSVRRDPHFFGSFLNDAQTRQFKEVVRDLFHQKHRPPSPTKTGEVQTAARNPEQRKDKIDFDKFKKMKDKWSWLLDDSLDYNQPWFEGKRPARTPDKLADQMSPPNPQRAPTESWEAVEHERMLKEDRVPDLVEELLRERSIIMDCGHEHCRAKRREKDKARATEDKKDKEKAKAELNEACKKCEEKDKEEKNIKDELQKTEKRLRELEDELQKKEKERRELDDKFLKKEKRNTSEKDKEIERRKAQLNTAIEDANKIIERLKTKKEEQENLHNKIKGEQNTLYGEKKTAEDHLKDITELMPWVPEACGDFNHTMLGGYGYDDEHMREEGCEVWAVEVTTRAEARLCDESQQKRIPKGRCKVLERIERLEKWEEKEAPDDKLNKLFSGTNHEHGLDKLALPDWMHRWRVRFSLEAARYGRFNQNVVYIIIQRSALNDEGRSKHRVKKGTWAADVLHHHLYVLYDPETDSPEENLAAHTIASLFFKYIHDHDINHTKRHEHPTVSFEVMGHESRVFRTLFPRIGYLLKRDRKCHCDGVWSSASESYEHLHVPMYFKIRATRNGCIMDEVALVRSLRPGEQAGNDTCFAKNTVGIYIARDGVFVFRGKAVTPNPNEHTPENVLLREVWKCAELFAAEIHQRTVCGTLRVSERHQDTATEVKAWVLDNADQNDIIEAIMTLETLMNKHQRELDQRHHNKVMDMGHQDEKKNKERKKDLLKRVERLKKEHHYSVDKNMFSQGNHRDHSPPPEPKETLGTIYRVSATPADWYEASEGKEVDQKKKGKEGDQKKKAASEREKTAEAWRRLGRKPWKDIDTAFLSNKDLGAYIDKGVFLVDFHAEVCMWIDAADTTTTRGTGYQQMLRNVNFGALADQEADPLLWVNGHPPLYWAHKLALAAMKDLPEPPCERTTPVHIYYKQEEKEGETRQRFINNPLWMEAVAPTLKMNRRPPEEPKEADRGITVRDVAKGLVRQLARSYKRQRELGDHELKLQDDMCDAIQREIRGLQGLHQLLARRKDQAPLGGTRARGEEGAEGPTEKGVQTDTETERARRIRNVAQEDFSFGELEDLMRKRLEMIDNSLTVRNCKKDSLESLDRYGLDHAWPGFTEALKEAVEKERVKIAKGY